MVASPSASPPPPPPTESPPHPSPPPPPMPSADPSHAFSSHVLIISNQQTIPAEKSLFDKFLGAGQLLLAVALLIVTKWSVDEAEKQRVIAAQALQKTNEGLELARMSAKDAGEDARNALEATSRIADAGYLAARAGFSSAEQAILGNVQSKKQGFNTALLSARLEGFRRFSDAFSKLDSTFYRTQNAIPESGFDFEENSEINSITLERYQKVAPYFKDVVSAGAEFMGAVDSSRGIWPGNLETLIQKARADGFTLARCSQTVGSAPLNQEELEKRRAELKKYCGPMENEYNAFRRSGGIVIGSMVNEIRVTLKDLGLDVRPFFVGHRALRPDELK